MNYKTKTSIYLITGIFLLSGAAQINASFGESTIGLSIFCFLVGAIFIMNAVYTFIENNEV
jgi:hypothetical protein